MFQKMLSIAVLALALSACSSDPTCEDVVDHVLKMAKDDMAKRFANLPEDQRKEIEEMAAKEAHQGEVPGAVQGQVHQGAAGLYEEGDQPHRDRRV